MSRSDWRLYVALGLIAASAATIAVVTFPSIPQLRSYGEEEPRTADYRPGGHDCQPDVLTKLASTKRSVKADECRKAAEEYRQSTNDLIQQTRAASAAEAQATIASQGLWTAWFQTIGGFLTLAAAGAAALYARSAWKETERGADAAHAANRAWLSVELTSWSALAFGDRTAHLEAVVTIENFGTSPATNILPVPEMVAHHNHHEVVDPWLCVKNVANIIKNISVHDERVGFTIFPGKKATQTLGFTMDRSHFGVAEHPDHLGDPMFFFVAVGLRYRCGTMRGETIVGYTVMDKESNDMAIDWKKGSIPADRLTFQDTLTGYAK